MKRRTFLQAGLASAGLLLECWPDGLVSLAQNAALPTIDPSWHPGAWLSIDPEGQVTIMVARSEMGQGVRTSLAMIVAEELDADWSRVVVRQASPGPSFTQMRTSGSGSVMGGWETLRRAGAVARAMLLQAAAAAWQVPVTECRTERGSVIHPASGRRYGYGELVDAAGSLEAPENVPLKESLALVGTPVRRVDGPDIVAGSATYGFDLRMPGMLRAVVARPPRFGAVAGTVENIPEVMAIEGVEQILSIPAGVAVVARSTWAALEGRRKLRVTWTGGETDAFDSRAHAARLVEATAEPGLVARSEGDPAAALAGAARRLDAVYEYSFQAHAPMEPMNAVARVNGDSCEIWTGTQAANQLHEAVAGRLGIEPAKIRIHVTLLGGGFGRRLGHDCALEAVDIAKEVDGPVQVVWTREDDLKHGFFQPPSAHRMAAGLDTNGRPVAWKHTMAGSPLTALRKPDLDDPDLARNLMWGGYDNPYAFPSVLVDHVLVTIPVPTGPWRAVHYPPGVFARECFLDEIAAAGGVDPLEARIELLGGASATGENARLVRALRAAAARAGWGGKLPPGRGLGIAGNIYHGATVMAQVADVSVSGGTVKVHRIVCAIDCGTVVNPLGLEGQVESAIVWGLASTLFGEITFSGGSADQRTFVDYPVPRLPDMPGVEVEILPSDLPPLGIGEQPVAPVTAAVANAVFAATGRRVRRCPIRPQDLL